MAIPNSMEQLSAMVATGQFGAIPGMMPNAMMPPNTFSPPGGMLTQDQIASIVDQRIAIALAKIPSTAPAAAPAGPDMSKLAAIVGQAENLFQRALPAQDYAAFHAYTQAGAAGFSDIMKSEALYPIVQLLWETIKENAK